MDYSRAPPSSDPPGERSMQGHQGVFKLVGCVSLKSKEVSAAFSMSQRWLLACPLLDWWHLGGRAIGQIYTVTPEIWPPDVGAPLPGNDHCRRALWISGHFRWHFIQINGTVMHFLQINGTVMHFLQINGIVSTPWTHLALLLKPALARGYGGSKRLVKGMGR